MPKIKRSTHSARRRRCQLVSLPAPTAFEAECDGLGDVQTFVPRLLIRHSLLFRSTCAERVEQGLDNTAFNLPCPDTELFTPGDFAACIFCLGNLPLQPSNQTICDNFARPLAFISPISAIYHIAKYLRSEVLFDHVCHNMLTVESAAQLLKLLLRDYEESNYYIQNLYRFLRTTCNISRETVQLHHSLAKDHLRNVLRTYNRTAIKEVYSKMKIKCISLPVKCPHCSIEITSVHDSDLATKSIPLACCSELIHLRCQQALLRSTSTICPSCQSEYFEAQIDTQDGCLHGYLNRHQSLYYNISPLHYRVRTGIFNSPPYTPAVTPGLCHGHPG